jgi:hypothetical protein
VTGPVELWVRFSVAFPYLKPSGHPMDRTFGLVVDLTIDGGRQVFGHGGRHPQGLREFEGVVHYMTNLTPGSAASPTRFTATTMIKALPACPRTLGGTITTTSGTALVEAHVLLERAN